VFASVRATTTPALPLKSEESTDDLTDEIGRRNAAELTGSAA
jgi:hypothetical protein